MDTARGMVSSSRASSACLCEGRSGASVIGNSWRSGEAVASASMNVAISCCRIFPSRSHLVSSHHPSSACDPSFIRRLSSPVEDLRTSISARSAPKPKRKVLLSARRSGRAPGARLGHCFIESFQSVAGGNGHSRARHVLHVAKPPAADTITKRTSSEGLGDDLVEELAREGAPLEGLPPDLRPELIEELPREDDPIEGLPPELRPELMPKHVAIILDGNSRWATLKGVPKSVGHATGVKTFLHIAQVANKWGIPALTVFIFSTENWRRPKEEVDFLMNLFETEIRARMESVMREKIRLRFIGDTKALPLSLQKTIESAQQTSSGNSGLILNLCLSYSGRADLVRACQKLATQVAQGSLAPGDIDDAAIRNQLYLSELGALQDPDLVIRTSGEQRLSNFLLWQIAYSELTFLDVLWPDFRKKDLRAALLTYQQRNRRYGARKSEVDASASNSCP